MMPHYSENYIEKLVSASKLPTADKTQDSVKEIGDNKSEPSSPNSQEDLLNLFKLLCFIQAWSDPIEAWNETNDIARKKIRQLMKFKRNIRKSTRSLIHLGLYKSVSESLQKFKQAAENANEAKFIEQLFDELKKSYTNPEFNTNTKKKLLIKIVDELLVYKKFEFQFENKEIFLEATKLITSFTRWPDELFKGIGNSIGFIAALACGLSAGGAIFVLLVGFSLVLAIPLSLLIFLACTKANFQLFSQHILPFFQDLFKNGRITEFIDQQGKRTQLSVGKKFLLIPAGFLSLSVGVAAAAITYLEGVKMIALICPMLAVTCPYLPVALLSILASALLMGLTTVMFRTFIGVLQSQFSRQKIKQDIKEKWQSLNWTKVLVYILKILVMAVAFFGLCYLDFTGTATLAGLLGWAAADAITLAAIMGDLPFTLITALALCDSLLTKSNSNPDFTKDIKYYLRKIVEFLALIINALGNAALVFTDSCASRIASIFCFINSYASNRTQVDDSELNQARERATQSSLSSLFKLTEARIPEGANDGTRPLNNCLTS